MKQQLGQNAASQWVKRTEYAAEQKSCQQDSDHVDDKGVAKIQLSSTTKYQKVYLDRKRFFMKQQLIDLRTRMQQAGVDAYIIPTTDFHGSEYVNDYFKCRKFGRIRIMLMTKA